MSGKAQRILDEALDCLAVIDDLVDQGAMPDVEASDFRASIEIIRDLAFDLGAVEP